MGRCGYVRRRAHACLVAEQAAPDALHERCAGTAAHRLLPTEGIGDDQLHDLGQPPEIEEHDAQRKDDIPQCHDRDDHPAHTGDTVDASEDDQQREQRQAGADPMVVEAESPLPGRADRVALHRVEGETECHGDQHGEEDAHPAFAQSAFHVVGRAADIGVPPLAFVELGEGRFDEGTRRTQQGDDPHPEDGARPARDDGRGHTHDVAGANGARQRRAHALELADGLFLAGGMGGDALVGQDSAEGMPHPVAPPPQLEAPGAHRQQQPGAEEQPQPHRSPYDAVHDLDSPHEPLWHPVASFDELKRSRPLPSAPVGRSHLPQGDGFWLCRKDSLLAKGVPLGELARQSRA